MERGGGACFVPSWKLKKGLAITTALAKMLDPIVD
jgi:hypothetical protein